MIKCNQGDSEGRCKLKQGKCDAAVPHSLQHATDRHWIDTVSGRYVCGRAEGLPINIEDADLSPQEDKEA